MTDNRQPKIWARVPEEEREKAQAAADQHYDGNLSMLVRLAVRRFIGWLDDARTDEPKEEAA